jgi:ADA HAT complex component 1
MILKRSTDGKMVKLVCLDCRRENFNSAQGFINDCRIAHGRGFQSHDAAARACGEEVEYNEAGAVVSDPAAVASTDTAGLVHPLIRSDGLADVGQVLTMARFSKKKTNTKANAPNRTADAPPVNQQGGFVATKPQSRPNEHMPRDGRPRTPFVPSPSTPHLSTLFTNAGRGGDLDGFVREAKTKSDLDSILSDDEDDPEGPEMDRAGLLAASGRGASGIEMRGARLPAHTVLSPTPMTRPLSSKGPDRSRAHKPEFLNRILPHSSLASLATSRSHNGEMVSTPTEHNTTMVLANPTPHDLSPVTTETHPAPSLVSDDDDDDYGDPHSDSDTHSSDADDDVDDDRYVEVEVQYEAEVGGPSVDPELRTSGKARAHGARTSQNGGVLGGEGIIRATERRQGGRRERRGKRGA